MFINMGVGFVCSVCVSHVCVCTIACEGVPWCVCPCDCMAGCVWVSPQVVMKCLVSQAQCLNLGLQSEGATSQKHHSAQPGHHTLL